LESIDGFHSSASDPLLQQKYGHIIEKKNIAPPPTGSIPSYGYNTNPSITTGTAGPGMPPSIAPYPVGGGGVYSRYVAYDAVTNTAITPPSVLTPTTVPQMNPSTNYGYPMTNYPPNMPGPAPSVMIPPTAPP
jgi:hypothetical protein